MPKEKEPLSLDEADEAPKSKKKLIIIIAAALITLVIAAVAVFFIFFNSEPEITDEVVVDATAESTESVKVKAVNYVPMPRPIVFNVMEGKRDRTVQIKVQLMVTNSDSEVLARKHIPLLEGTLVRVFGRASAKQLRSPEGKDQLRKTALKELNDATTKLEGRALIHTVLFTGFVLQ